MKFVIYREVNEKRKTLIEWDQSEIFERIEKKLGKKGVNAFKEIIKEFKDKSITIP